MNTKLPPITGTAEIALSVRSIPTMQQFYTEVLGFQLHSEAAYNAKGEYVPEGEPTITFLTISETDSPLGRSDHPQLLALIDHRRHTSSRPGHNPDTSTLHHLAFEIPPE
ncbi:MAG: VOC family protein, partial [Cyanothece sp. SIO1E1]|nr:VOC family protein [Cyanothece sp. SIO1E1]